MTLNFENYDVEADARRVRLSVSRRIQSALFRRMRFSSPGQTSSRLT